jgi:hypothetical protein
MKIKITDITDWEEDTQMMDGDASHEGDRAVQRLLEEERVKKIDEGEWDGLPFVCDAEDIEEAIEKYNDAYCEYNYIKATDCDWEEVAEFNVVLEKDSPSKRFHVILSSVSGSEDGKYKLNVRDAESGKTAEMWYDDEGVAKEDVQKFLSDSMVEDFDWE